ncbi:unnamed protein product [Trichogramma brassicae]|uniref:Uncharacterized protein n=1 Tax=Trichogramma brassicae TaxID=86971 RepID=A0A6H5IX33_9HYME|nr:unnamed protein product [Trichogramma brassicae]
MAYVDKVNFEKLKDLRKVKFEQLKDSRKKVSWTIERDRVEFLCRFDSIIGAWKGPPPNLRDIFRPEEIESLLSDSILDYCNGKRVVEFVVGSGYKDEPETDKDGKPLQRRTTALHRAARIGLPYDVIKSLFEVYNRFSVNFTDELGLTHFHIACQYGFDDVIRKFLRLGQDVNMCGHWSQLADHKKVVELLLRWGADLNCVNYEGLTRSGIESLRMFFARYPINAQDNWGDSLLHFAVRDIDKQMAEFLLRNGANPNLTNEEGSTPLHVICRSYRDDDDLVKAFFEINDDIRQTVRIDARDGWGNTPLHLALRCCCKNKTVELLLRRGADPNLTNEGGATPLHIICGQRCHTSCVDHDNMAKLLFEICDDKRQSMQIDARDKSGRTPLQWAVANLKPYLVDLILDHGADLSSFVLANYFPEGLESKDSNSFKLSLAAGAMAIVKSLEKRGYELDLSDALKVMQFFNKIPQDKCSYELFNEIPQDKWSYGLFNKIPQDKWSYGSFKKTENLEKCWYDDKKFASIAKNAMIIPDLSLYDLIRISSREQGLTHTCSCKALYSVHLQHTRAAAAAAAAEDELQSGLEGCREHKCLTAYLPLSELLLLLQRHARYIMYHELSAASTSPTYYRDE